MPDPQDAAAILLLRAVLEDLEAERTYAPLLAAEEGERGLYRLTVGVRLRDAPAGRAPAVQTAGRELEHGDPCDVCGAALVETSSSIMCSRCGVRRQLPGV